MKTFKIFSLLAGTLLMLNPATAATNSNAAENTDRALHENRDVELTQKIRQAIVTDKTLGQASKNVVINATHNSIILEGTVPSQMEKNKIEAIARNHSRNNVVSNHIRVSGS